MPVLPPAYFGNLQHIYIGNNLYLLERFSQTQKVALNAKPMIQGTIGTRVMDVGEMTWDTTIESSALIVANDYAGSFNDIFGLIDLAWANIRSANNVFGNPSLPLMKQAKITINKDKVGMTATFTSGNPAPFEVRNERDSSGFIARLVRWFDCTLVATSMPQGFSGPFSNQPQTTSLGIESAEIDLTAKITPRYFVGSPTQEPYFSIDNYEVSGSITAIATASDMVLASNLISPQSRGALSLNGPQYLILYIGTRSIGLGLSSLKSEFTRTVNAGDVNRISIKFTSFTT
jgi:hypothetical protein